MEAVTFPFHGVLNEYSSFMYRTRLASLHSVRVSGIIMEEMIAAEVAIGSFPFRRFRVVASRNAYNNCIAHACV